MPTHLLLRTAWQLNDADPKNQLVINPKFRHQTDFSSLGGPDFQALTDDLATAVATWTAQASCQVTVKAYNLEKDPPNYPLATTVRNPGSFLITRGPPQLSCCLSYYSGQNIPRKRGRLYLPGNVLSNTAADFGSGVVPSVMRTKILALPAIFASLGGLNVDWIVWSQVAQLAGRVDNYWCDDSWDIIRRRKLKPVAARQTGTTSG